METQSSNACDKTVYLCQVSPNVSCGACCGLYNVADPSPQAMEAMLSRRTKWFAHVPRTVAGIDAFKERVERTDTPEATVSGVPPLSVPWNYRGHWPSGGLPAASTGPGQRWAGLARAELLWRHGLSHLLLPQRSKPAGPLAGRHPREHGPLVPARADRYRTATTGRLLQRTGKPDRQTHRHRRLFEGNRYSPASAGPLRP